MATDRYKRFSNLPRLERNEEWEEQPKIIGKLWGLADKEFDEDEYRLFTSRPLVEKVGERDRLYLLSDRGPYKKLLLWKEDLDEDEYEEIKYSRRGRAHIPLVREDDEIVAIGPKLWAVLFRLMQGQANDVQLIMANISWFKLPNGFCITCMNRRETSKFMRTVHKRAAQKIKQLSQGFFVRGKLLQELFAVYQIFSSSR